MNKLTLLFHKQSPNNSHLFVFHVNVLGPTAGARGGQHLHFASLLEHVNDYITAGGIIIIINNKNNYFKQLF